MKSVAATLFNLSQPSRMSRSANSAHNEHFQNGKRRTAPAINNQAPSKRRSGSSAQAKIAKHSEAPASIQSPGQASATMDESSPEPDWQPVTSDLSPFAQRDGFHHDAADSSSHRLNFPGSHVGKATRSRRTASDTSTIIIRRPNEDAGAQSSDSVEPRMGRSRREKENDGIQYEDESQSEASWDSQPDLLDQLDRAMESDLWKHVEGFVLPSTLSKLTKTATDSEIQALIQLLSYPKRRSLEKDWVALFQKGNRRRMLLVISFVLRAVSDTNSACDTCSTDEDLSQHCSELREIQPEHHVLKELVGGQCCNCVVHEKECETTLDTANEPPKPASRNVPEVLEPEVRQMSRRKLVLMLLQAARTKKFSLPPSPLSYGQYAQQCARNVERRVFESRISNDDYDIKIETLRTKLTKLRGQAAAQWLSEAFHDRLPVQSLCATIMPSSPAQEEPEVASEHLESEHARDRRQDSSLYEQSGHPDLSTGEHRSAQDPPEQRFSAASSPVIRHPDSVRNTTNMNEDLPGGHEAKSSSSIIKRSLTIGMNIQKLEERDRFDMIQWFEFVDSTEDLSVMKKALELAIIIQDLPLELRREPCQACIGLLQSVLPKETSEKWVATMFNASKVFLELQRDISELKIASRGQRVPQRVRWHGPESL